nr:ribonuclease H-like domain-containing protein [Tanacetum cinerariifolium]
MIGPVRNPKGSHSELLSIFMFRTSLFNATKEVIRVLEFYRAKASGSLRLSTPLRTFTFAIPAGSGSGSGSFSFLQSYYIFIHRFECLQFRGYGSQLGGNWIRWVAVLAILGLHHVAAIFVQSCLKSGKVDDANRRVDDAKTNKSSSSPLDTSWICLAKFLHKLIKPRVSNKNDASTSGKKKQAEVSRQEVSNSSPFDALILIENDDDLDKNDKLEGQMVDGKILYVDDDGNTLVSTGNVDSEMVFDENANLMASTSFKCENDRGYGTNSLLKQWRKTKRDDDYDPYDDDFSGDLYPVTKPSTSPIAFLSISASTWHQRLGHPGDQVLRLLRSLYGLKQAPRAWFQGLQVMPHDLDFIIVDAIPHCLSIDRKYALQLIECAHMATCNPSRTLVDTKSKLILKGYCAWLRKLLCELQSPLSTVTLVYYDNVSVVYMFANLVQHQRMKHIEIDIYFVRDMDTAGQRNHAIKVTNSGNKGDEAASYVVDTVKEANEKLKQDFTALKDGTNDMVGRATDSAGKLQDDIQVKANDIAGQTSNLANEMKDKVNDLVSDLNENAKDTSQDMKKSIQDTAAFVADKAEDGKSEVAKIAEAVVDKTNEAGVGALDAAEGTTKKIKEAIVDLKQ